MPFMAVTEPPGDFDYLLGALGDTDDNVGFDDDYDVGFDDDYSVDRYRRQPQVLWYRTTGAMVAIGAISIAGIAILVSVVLLMSRDSGGPANNVETTTTSTPSSAAPETTPPTAAVPPSPTGSPSPTESTASAPPVIVEPRRSEPTKPPQIGVTRTPLTRYPISVRPPNVPHF